MHQLSNKYLNDPLDSIFFRSISKITIRIKVYKSFFLCTLLYSIFDNKGSGYSNTEIEHKVNNTEQVKLYFT